MIIWAFVIVFIHKFTWCICHLNFLQPTYDNTLKRQLFHQFLEKKLRKSLVAKAEQLKPRVMLTACPMCPPNLALSAQLPSCKPPGNNAEWLSEIHISACSLCGSILLQLVFVVYNSTSVFFSVLSGLSTYSKQWSLQICSHHGDVFRWQLFSLVPFIDCISMQNILSRTV